MGIDATDERDSVDRSDRGNVGELDGCGWWLIGRVSDLCRAVGYGMVIPTDEMGAVWARQPTPNTAVPAASTT